MKNSFEGTVAVITGAASGLGFAIAKKLSACGATLALLDIQTDSLHTVKHDFENEPAIFKVDITNEREVKNAIILIGTTFGKIDILINCAGITGITNTKSHETSTENIRLVFDVNFMGSYFTSKYVLPVMLQKNYGRILHIASIAGKEGNAGMLAYSASKAAVIGMTKVQGKEYAETGITINAIAPAVIRTAMHDTMPIEQFKYMTDKIPMKRSGTLDELADMAAFIVSPRNSFTTGFTFDLSGGRATY
ncbi:MAG TPA: SDR family NAD(P)-dependent oxidoreductase [Panacibacter sp.]|nr:SDR family NAD(P)-dependent oxidoreductase [Panacibacter sp.]